MSFDPSRLEAGAWAAVSAFIWASLRFAAVLFGVPPPERRTLARAAFELIVAVPTGFLFGYGFCQPFAAFLTGLCTWLVALFHPPAFVIDPIAAGVLLGMFMARSMTLFYDIVSDGLADALRRFFKGFAR